jgi:hypothetical protein
MLSCGQFDGQGCTLLTYRTFLFLPQFFFLFSPVLDIFEHIGIPISPFLPARSQISPHSRSSPNPNLPRTRYSLLVFPFIPFIAKRTKGDEETGFSSGQPKCYPYFSMISAQIEGTWVAQENGNKGGSGRGQGCAGRQARPDNPRNPFSPKFKVSPMSPSNILFQ